MAKLPKKHDSFDSSRLEKLYAKISNHIESAKKAFQRTVDTEMVKAYWLIGRDIIKEEIICQFAMLTVESRALLRKKLRHLAQEFISLSKQDAKRTH